jgi:predicted permease
MHGKSLLVTLEQAAQDVRAGTRILTRTPALAATAAALVALVIGGNTIVFSVAHAVLAKPAPGITASRLVTLTWVRKDGWVDPATLHGSYVQLARSSTRVRPLVAYHYDRFAVSHGNGTFGVWGASVSAGYFGTLGVPIGLGRSFTEQEHAQTASAVVAIISHRAWQEFFDGSPGVVGTPILLNGHPATIVGVAAPPFRGTQLAPSVDVWVPIGSIGRGPDGRYAVGVVPNPLNVFGRLADGQSLAAAQAEVSAIWSRLQADDPLAERDTAATLVRYSVTAGGNSFVAMSGDAFLALFAIITAITLAIVCANVANLLVGRALIRQRELALRQSLGASRIRIVRMLMAEGLMLAMVALAAAGIFAAWVSTAAVEFVASNAPGGVAPVDFTPDWTVAGYALLLTVFSTIAFTTVPALRAWRQPPLPWLKTGEQGVVAGRSTLSTGLVVLQLACSVLLLTSAGLAYRSISLLASLDLRFDTRNLALMTINTAGSAADDEAHAAVLERVRERIQNLPGVVSVSYARSAPREMGGRVAVRPSPSDAPVFAEEQYVGPAYLEAHGLRPIAGLDVERDRRSAVPPAIVSQALAEMLWPGQPAVGRALFIGPRAREATVAGVTPDAFFGGYRRTDRPAHVLLPFREAARGPGEATVYIRYTGALDAVAVAARRAVRDLDPLVPVVYLRSMDAQLDSLIWPVRVLATLMTFFAIGSLLIAIVGQSPVVTFDTRRRVRGFGVRIAVGASPRQVVASVIRDGLRLTAAGLAIGFLLSAGAATALGRMLYGVTPTDALTYAGVFAILLAASMLACSLPARRAARTNPLDALRFE